MFLSVRGAGERRVAGIPVRENHFLLYEAMSFIELENYFGFQRLCIGQYLIPGIEMSINRINCRHEKNLDCKKVTRYNCAQLVFSLLNEHVIMFSINDHYLFLLTFSVKLIDRLLFSCQIGLKHPR